jgi:hypothetical protein
LLKVLLKVPLLKVPSLKASSFADSATPRGTLSKTFSKWALPHIKGMTAAAIIVYCTMCMGCKDYNEAILKV